MGQRIGDNGGARPRRGRAITSERYRRVVRHCYLSSCLFLSTHRKKMRSMTSIECGQMESMGIIIAPDEVIDADQVPREDTRHVILERGKELASEVGTGLHGDQATPDHTVGGMIEALQCAPATRSRIRRRRSAASDSVPPPRHR